MGPAGRTRLAHALPVSDEVAPVARVASSAWLPSLAEDVTHE